MREYNHKPGKAFKDLPLETLTELLLPAVHELLKALDKKDPSLIMARKKEVELLYCAIDAKKPKPVAEQTPVPTVQETTPPDKHETREIEKQIKGKNKELKVLGKEIKSRRKKRSGAVISDDITRIANDVVELNGKIFPGINEQS